MSNKTIDLTDGLYAYMLSVATREPDVLRALREETASHPYAGMQIAPDQGQFMAWLIKLTGARRCIEVGVFTGYSSTAVALAMPDDGQLIALDVSEEFTAIARRYWAKAGVDAKISLRLGPATESMDALIAAGGAGSYDFVFIDADKSNYKHYYERALTLLRPGGICAIDNVLWGGRVADERVQDVDTLAIRGLNAFVHGDERVDVSLVPIADGLTLARKR